MPRTKGSKDRPKTTNDYASQITEKQEQIAETLIAKYVLVETKAPEGYVRSEKEESVIFAYEDGNTKEIEITKELTNERIPTGGYSNSPKTEDDTNIWLPFFLLLLSVGGIAGIIWYTKRKNHD